MTGTGGAELPLLWGAIFVVAMAEAAIRFASLARLEEDAQGPGKRARYGEYLEHARSMEAVCIALRAAATGAMVGIVVARAISEQAYLLVPVLWSMLLVAAAELPARVIGRKLSAAILRAALPVLYALAWPLRVAAGIVEPPETEQDEEPEPEVVEAAMEEIRVAIEDGTAEGALEAEEKHMIEGIMKFGDVDVAEIMTPRTELECIEADTPLPDAVRALSELIHSRVPVYEETIDRIVGMLYVKDLLAAVSGAGEQAASLRDVIREPLFVPETNTVGSLLRQFQREHVQVAVVVDEYGGVVGLVTVEDIMEEIVGEIQDEYDQEDAENRIRHRASGALEVDARTRIDEVNELLDVDVPEDEDYDTMGGYVTAHLARVPNSGEEFRAHGLLVRVLQSDERRVRRLFLRRIDDAKD